MNKRQENIAMLERRKYKISEAIDFFQSSPKVKFNEAIDTAINLGIDPSKSDQNMRGATLLPAGSGKPCKVAVFVEGDMAAAAKDAGADAAKFQSFKTEQILSKKGFEKKISFQSKWKTSVWDVYNNAELPIEWIKKPKQSVTSYLKPKSS